MEKQNTEVHKLNKDIQHNGVYFLDKDVLKRIIELRDHFSDDIIRIVRMRMSDHRTNAQILEAFHEEMEMAH